MDSNGRVVEYSQKCGFIPSHLVLLKKISCFALAYQWIIFRDSGRLNKLYLFLII